MQATEIRPGMCLRFVTGLGTDVRKVVALEQPQGSQVPDMVVCEADTATGTSKLYAGFASEAVETDVPLDELNAQRWAVIGAADASGGMHYWQGGVSEGFLSLLYVLEHVAARNWTPGFPEAVTLANFRPEPVSDRMIWQANIGTFRVYRADGVLHIHRA